jgi:hypothetical protein
MVRSQLRMRRIIATAGLVMLLLLWMQGLSASRLIGAWLFTILVSETLRFWRRWRPDDPPAEFAVGIKSLTPAPGQPHVVTTVPNSPLGLSDLVLCRPSTGSGARAVWTDESTIQRTFSQTEAFRVCAAVNVGDRPASAAVDVVDASGRTARHLDAKVVVGGLAAVPRSWDDLVEADPPDHFGRLDATVDLRDLVPGRYTVRLTVTDGEQLSARVEPITIDAGRVGS